MFELKYPHIEAIIAGDLSRMGITVFILRHGNNVPSMSGASKYSQFRLRRYLWSLPLAELKKITQATEAAV